MPKDPKECVLCPNLVLVFGNRLCPECKASEDSEFACQKIGDWPLQLGPNREKCTDKTP